MSSDDKLTDLLGHEDKELSTLYHRADKPEPPAQLDARIRAAARTPRRYRRPAYWLSGVAATLIVGVLVVQLYPPALQPPETALQRQSQEAPAGADALHAPVAREQLPAAAAAKARSAPVPVLESRKELAVDNADQGEPLPAAAPAAAGLAEEATAAPLRELANPEAQMRLDAVLRLLEAGDISAAQRAWDDFIKAYPDLQLPAAAQRQLAPLQLRSKSLQDKEKD